MEIAGDGNGPKPKVVKDYTLHASEVRVAFSWARVGQPKP